MLNIEWLPPLFPHLSCAQMMHYSRTNLCLFSFPDQKNGSLTYCMRLPEQKRIKWCASMFQSFGIANRASSISVLISIFSMVVTPV